MEEVKISIHEGKAFNLYQLEALRHNGGAKMVWVQQLAVKLSF